MMWIASIHSIKETFTYHSTVWSMLLSKQPFYICNCRWYLNQRHPDHLHHSPATCSSVLEQQWVENQPATLAANTPGHVTPSDTWWHQMALMHRPRQASKTRNSSALFLANKIHLSVIQCVFCQEESFQVWYRQRKRVVTNSKKKTRSATADWYWHWYCLLPKLKQTDQPVCNFNSCLWWKS